MSLNRSAIVASIVLTLAGVSSGPGQAGLLHGPLGADALAPIVGVWQSDTTNGMSARSTCVWTPTHGGVLCEQEIATPDGPRHALNLFTYDPKGHAYALYAVMSPGATVEPVPLAIDGRIWTYGGLTAAPNGQTYRTINDFSMPDSYSWRLESSLDGKTWVIGPRGQSRRVP